jgi:uncharacterized protein (DUF1810 family)
VTFDLDRFTRAQDGGGFSTALAELEAGRKRSHWIWFIFPQLSGLGNSPMAIEYGLKGVEEAAAYLGEPRLRDRLLAVTNAVLTHLRRQPAPALSDLMGAEIDALKLVSSMTLFREVARRAKDDAVATAADAVLQAAKRQGFSECEFTLSRAGLSGPPSWRP